MIPLLDATKEIKNGLWDTGIWTVLLTLKNKDESIVLRLCSNIDDITFKDEVYTATPFRLGDITESNSGELPTVAIVLSNVNRLTQSYVEEDPNFGCGWLVHVDMVHTTNIEAGISEVYYDFITMNVSEATEEHIIFECGIANPLRKQFPRVRMLPNSCQHNFKKGGCIYSGTDTTCSKSLQACRDKFIGETKIPFLGFPSIPTMGIYQ